MRSWFFSSFFSPPSSSASPFLSISLTAEESLTAALKKRKGRHDGAIRLYTAQTGTTNHGRGKKPKKNKRRFLFMGSTPVQEQSSVQGREKHGREREMGGVNGRGRVGGVAS